VVSIRPPRSCLLNPVGWVRHPSISSSVYASPDSFPSSAAFDLISGALFSSDAQRKDTIKKTDALFTFTLKNDSGETQSWYIDLKDKGELGKGEAPEGKKADVVLLLSDADFGRMVQGKANAQQLFMSGKLKIRGNIMKATKLEPIMNSARTKAKL
jgi:putative sterol carrier protein